MIPHAAVKTLLDLLIHSSIIYLASEKLLSLSIFYYFWQHSGHSGPSPFDSAAFLFHQHIYLPIDQSIGFA